MNLMLILIGIAFCVFASAFFSASEMSYSSCNQLRLEKEKEEGSKRAGMALRIAQRFDDALGAILIGNNLVNIAASSLGSVLIILITGSDVYAWISTVTITLLVIVFGETIPKITAKKSANITAMRNAYVLNALMVILKPVIFCVVALVDLLTRGMKGDTEVDADEAVEELQMLIKTAEDEEVLDEEQTELVQAVIGFSDVSAQEVLTARVDVEAIDIEDEWEDILAVVEQTPYSRLPVYEGSIDNIIGVLYLNHFLKALADGGETDIRRLLMPPCYVYKTTKLPKVLNMLCRTKQHLAIVTDEYGGTLGVLSMEDVLEQIVGDILDETDATEQVITAREDGSYELDGDVMIDELLELFEIKEDEFEGESETVGGWTLESFDGNYPEAGESFRYRNLKVTVMAMDGRRVERVLVEPITEEPVREEPTGEEPISEEPVTGDPVTERTAVEGPVTEKSATEKSAAEEPVAEKSAAERSAAWEPIAARSISVDPTSGEPITAKAEKPERPDRPDSGPSVKS